jgi:hypothetical protein
LSLSIATTTVQLIGHCRVFDNPRLLAERKAKKLKSLLDKARRPSAPIVISLYSRPWRSRCAAMPPF